jgi:hypothetical protein
LIPELEQEKDAHIEKDESVDNSEESIQLAREYSEFRFSPEGKEARKKELDEYICRCRWF